MAKETNGMFVDQLVDELRRMLSNFVMTQRLGSGLQPTRALKIVANLECAVHYFPSRNLLQRLVFMFVAGVRQLCFCSMDVWPIIRHETE